MLADDLLSAPVLLPLPTAPTSTAARGEAEEERQPVPSVLAETTTLASMQLEDRQAESDRYPLDARYINPFT